MESLAVAFANTLGRYVSKEIVVFVISMIPILELRGGLIVSQLIQVPITTAIPICIIGNIIPIPFILLFIKQIFKLFKKIKLFRGIIEKLENRAMSKSDNIKRYEFWGLVLCVGIPLQGTGCGAVGCGLKKGDSGGAFGYRDRYGDYVLLFLRTSGCAGGIGKNGIVDEGEKR